MSVEVNKRTVVYYPQPYLSGELDSNENANRLTRRFILKVQLMRKSTDKKVESTEN